MHSRQVRYKNDKSVEQAINELYEKAGELFAYHVGDEITVAGEKYYVMYDSPATQDYVVGFKYLSLSASEVNSYGMGYVNKNTNTSVGTSSNGNVAWYSSPTCGYVNGELNTTECVQDYDDSDIKHIVDGWATSVHGNNLKEIDGYTARLLSWNEIANGNTLKSDYNKIMVVNGINNYWLTYMCCNSDIRYVPTWGAHYSYSSKEYANSYSVRPVINVKKSAIQKTN